MKCLVICLILTTLTSITIAQNFECRFENATSWGYPHYLYICTVTRFPDILAPNIKISSPNGSHLNGKNNSLVQGLDLSNLTTKVHYFPKGLENYFPFLKGIKIKSMGLKEIHQNNLKPFTELIALNLFSNDITYIERDLFKFNTKLQAVSFQDNKISYVDLYAFHDLKNLKKLMIGSVCIKGSASTSSEIAGLIVSMEMKCSNVTQKMMLKEIRNDLRETKDEVEKDLRGIEERIAKQEIKMNEKREKINERLDLIDAALKLEVNSREKQTFEILSNLSSLTANHNNYQTENSKMIQNILKQQTATSEKLESLQKADLKVNQDFKAFEKQINEIISSSQTTNHENSKNIQNIIKQQTENIQKLDGLRGSDLKMNQDIDALGKQTKEVISNLSSQTANHRNYQIENSQKVENILKQQATASQKFNNEVQNINQEIMKIYKSLEENSTNHEELIKDLFNGLKAELKSNLTLKILSELSNETENQTKPQQPIKSDDKLAGDHLLIYVIIPFIALMTIMNIGLAVACCRNKMSLGRSNYDQIPLKETTRSD